ncbi:MAG: Holliday junction branch migration protein RuvA [Acutalibacteraceae bacterium]|nr:Holliday junction branch migration protein RuvA [Acutalibacteraceae bacterium]
MFYSLTGNVVYTDETSVALSCSGVAFRCYTSFNTLCKIGSTGETVTLYTYLSVREDALDLFGFYDTAELDCFKILIGVSGVGPKAAIAILSRLTPDKLSQAVATGDVKAITAAQGVGPKIAQRIIVELKDKLAPFATGVSSVDFSSVSAVNSSSGGSDAVDALMALGYSRSEASLAVGKLDQSLPVDELIKQALMKLAMNL